ncbi:mavicyanin-like [Benincasa hispida]|uniref:mavicyanin-like n=1 Tax=Benincasa hispida TaxID=102211 RepID=UPI0018FFA01C|nr:mavicyanin-like [Benincasa hispida]
MAMKAAAVFVVLVAVRAVYGADIIVGGNSGWSQGVNYETWAAGQNFSVGDTLMFNYAGSHSVAEVNEESYKACSSSSVIRSHTGGSTSIPLSKAGPRYFICPTPGHCASGMKLQVNVLAANSTPNPTPTPSTTGTQPPPSPSAAAPSAFFTLNHLIFGASVATLFVL